MKKAIGQWHKMYLIILKFLDEEIQQIVAWVVHRKSVEGKETKWSESLQVHKCHRLLRSYLTCKWRLLLELSFQELFLFVFLLL